LFSKPYLELKKVAAHRIKGDGLDQAKKTVQQLKALKNFSYFLFGNKSSVYGNSKYLGSNIFLLGYMQ